MSGIFLSASIPVEGRGDYYKTADPFLIQFAVREFVSTAIQNWTIVWGGHPAITPMVLTICQDLNVSYSDSVVLYQSRYFEDRFPQENRHFDNIVYTDAVPGDRAASLLHMREMMLSRSDLRAAVFIGGMDGVEAEYEIFKHFHPRGKVIPVASPGGAALKLAVKTNGYSQADLEDVDFARLFRSELSSLALED